jgi:hypothetical protein
VNLSEWREYLTPAAVTAAAAAFLRWFRPRRIIGYIADIKQRELLQQNANDWMKRAEYEKTMGNHWYQEAQECQKRLVQRHDNTDDSAGGFGERS